MPRIRQLAGEYAQADFRKEIFRCLAERYENVTVRALAAETQLSQSTLNTKIRHDLTNLDVSELQKIIPVLKPNPEIVLKLLGYTGEDIRKYVKSKTQKENLYD